MRSGWRAMAKFWTASLVIAAVAAFIAVAPASADAGSGGQGKAKRGQRVVAQAGKGQQSAAAPVSSRALLDAVPTSPKAVINLAGSAETEELLALERNYEIPKGVDVVLWFHELIDTVESHLRRDPKLTQEGRVIIGDAYHWIGHIYEERGDLEKAWRSYELAYGSYMMTELAVSPFLSNLGTRQHARFHLTDLAERTGRYFPKELHVRDEEFVETGRRIEDCKLFYQANMIKFGQTRFTRVMKCISKL